MPISELRTHPIPTPAANGDDFLTIYDIIAFALKWRLWLIIGGLTGSLIGLAISTLKPSVYEGEMLIPAEITTPAAADVGALNASLANAFSQTIATQNLANNVIKSLNALSNSAEPAPRASAEQALRLLTNQFGKDALSSSLAAYLSGPGVAMLRGAKPQSPFSLTIQAADAQNYLVSLRSQVSGAIPALAQAFAVSLLPFIENFNKFQIEFASRSLRALRSQALKSFESTLSDLTPNRVDVESENLRISTELALLESEISRIYNKPQPPISLAFTISADTNPDLVTQLRTTLRIADLRSRIGQAVAAKTLRDENLAKFAERLSALDRSVLMVHTQIGTPIHSAQEIFNAMVQKSGGLIHASANLIPSITTSADFFATAKYSESLIKSKVPLPFLYSFLGLFTGFFLALVAAVVAHIAKRAKHEIDQSRFS